MSRRDSAELVYTLWALGIRHECLFSLAKDRSVSELRAQISKGGLSVGQSS